MLYVCMGSSCHCIVAYAHLGNGTGRRTATMAAPLLLICGPVRYEAVLHSFGTNPVAEWLVPTCESAHSW